MSQDGLWHDATLDPPFRKTGEVWDQTTVELLTDNLIALGGSDGSSGFTVPIGGQIPYSGTVAPNSWWGLVDGAAISRTTYSKLFAAQSTNYGAGDGSTTFNKPDKRFRVSTGLDNMGTGAAGRNGSHTATQGGTGGETDHALSTAELAAHNHGVTDGGHVHGVTDPGHFHNTPSDNSAAAWGMPTNQNANLNGNTTTNTTGVTVNSASTGISIVNTGSGTAHNNLVPYQCDLWIIRLL